MRADDASDQLQLGADAAVPGVIGAHSFIGERSVTCLTSARLLRGSVSRMEGSRILEVFGDERNADPFRLAIIGYAKIDETLNEALTEAFGGELPRELRLTPFKTRVSLAIALNLMPEVFRGPLGKIAEVRHKVAHARIQELTASDARELYAAYRQLAPAIDTQVPQLKDEDQAEIHLANLLLFVEVGLLASFEEARERQAQQEEAMREWWERRAPSLKLTPEEIRKLVDAERADDQRAL
jgi:hypothetical protein